MKAIIDTNVLIAANGRDCPQVTRKCQLRTGQYLRDIQTNGIIVIDNRWLILNEYKNKVNQTGQPGIGDAFLKWVLSNQRNSQRCEQVEIHPSEDNSFREFPDAPQLEKFDPSDRKFVAVALTAPDRPPIVNAVDSDWAEFYEALTQCGVNLQFLCPDVIAPQPSKENVLGACHPE
jgi:hypothetical protein